ncbi:MAG: PepSY-associated TM helix domain-containing protein, partial [Acidobacteriota bacterium]
RFRGLFDVAAEGAEHHHGGEDADQPQGCAGEGHHQAKDQAPHADLHKQVGVWGLVFGLVMAFTGAALGLIGIFAPVMVLSAFGGDVEKATEAFAGPRVEALGEAAAMLPMEPLIARVESSRPGFVATSLFITHWRDAHAEVSINLDRDPYRQLASGETHRVSLVDGETLHVSTLTGRGLGSRLFGALGPVHYALFASLGLKMVYFISGLLLSLGIVSGTALWLERRRSAARDRYFWLARFHLGASLGLIVASVFSIAAGRFAAAAVEPVFWLTWGLWLVGTFGIGDGAIWIRRSSVLTGLTLVAVAGGDLLTSPRLTADARSVDLTLLALGLLVLAGVLLSIRMGPEISGASPRTAEEIS